MSPEAKYEQQIDAVRAVCLWRMEDAMMEWRDSRRPGTTVHARRAADAVLNAAERAAGDAFKADCLRIAGRPLPL